MESLHKLIVESFPTNLNVLSKLKAFAGNKLNNTEMMKSVFDWIENIVRKGENAGYQRFLLFPCFQKASETGSLNVVLV